MKFTLKQDALLNFSNELAAIHIPDETAPLKNKLTFKKALERLENNFKHNHQKYYRDDVGNPYFNHLHSDHLATWLYFLSNQCYKDKLLSLAEKFFYLNKIMNGLDVFYAIDLPEIFMLVHPVGTVLGNATYENYLVIYQNVTIGSTLEGIYPKIDENCILYSGSSIIGNTHLGRNSILGANSFVLNQDIPSNSTIVGQFPNTKISSNLRNNQLLLTQPVNYDVSRSSLSLSESQTL